MPNINVHNQACFIPNTSVNKTVDADALREPMSDSARNALAGPMLRRASGVADLARILAAYERLPKALVVKALNNAALAANPEALKLLASKGARYSMTEVLDAARVLLRAGAMSLDDACDVAKRVGNRPEYGRDNSVEAQLAFAYIAGAGSGSVARAVRLFAVNDISGERPERGAEFVAQAIADGRVTKFSDALAACEAVQESIPFLKFDVGLERGTIWATAGAQMFDAAATLCQSLNDVRALHQVALKTRGLCVPDGLDDRGGKGWYGEVVLLDGLESIMTKVSLSEVRELSKSIKGGILFDTARDTRQWWLNAAEAAWHQANE